MSIFKEQEKELKDKWFYNLIKKLREAGYKVTAEIEKKLCPKCDNNMYKIEHEFICPTCGHRETIH